MNNFHFNLQTAVQDNKVMQDFDLESLSIGGDHSRKVKAAPIGSNFSRFKTPYAICCFLILSCSSLQADPSSLQGSAKPYSIKTQQQSVQKKEEPVREYKPVVKPLLPSMLKPFGMPGVIGIINNKWEGTDYLGYLSPNIGVDVEIVKAENVPAVSDTSAIESRIAGIFTKEDIVPRSDAVEGPPLPFFHILFLIYPVDKDRYAIVANGRLFEQVQVIRKDFIPAGFWQAITWEIQDIALANSQQLDEEIKMLADKLATSFAKRYRQYNINREGMPK